MGDGRWAYAVRRRPNMEPVFSSVEIDDDLGVYPPRELLGVQQVGWEPDLPPGFPGSRLVYTQAVDGTPLVWTTGPPTQRGQWLIVATVVVAGSTFTATYPADNSRITETIQDPFGPEGPRTDYVDVGDDWDFFDVTEWAFTGADFPGKLKGVGT